MTDDVMGNLGGGLFRPCLNGFGTGAAEWVLDDDERIAISPQDLTHQFGRTNELLGHDRDRWQT